MNENVFHLTALLKMQTIWNKVHAWKVHSARDVIEGSTWKQQKQTRRNPVDTGCKLNVHKTFRRRPGCLLNVFCTFNLRLVSMGKCLFPLNLYPHHIKRRKYNSLLAIQLLLNWTGGLKHRKKANQSLQNVPIYRCTGTIQADASE